MSKPFFHELPQSEIDTLLQNKVTVGDIMEKYSQPKWCAYPNALEGAMGCWSLMDLNPEGLRTKISESFCKSCDCFKSSDNGK